MLKSSATIVRVVIFPDGLEIDFAAAGNVFIMVGTSRFTIEITA